MTRKGLRYENGDYRRAEIYKFIVAYKAARGGETPTVREMARMSSTSTSVIHFHLRGLERDGRIRLVRGDGGRVRHIAIPGETWAVRETS